MKQTKDRYRVGAVGYLNTTPLVWGMLHGPQSSDVELSLLSPAVCAQRVENAEVQIGLVPVAEIARQGLEIVPGPGISCLGPVRSILMFARVPWGQIRTLAADSSSRTSVELARVILRERFKVEPEVVEHKPELAAMMNLADAALIIGDPALTIEAGNTPYQWLDLGNEWYKLTQLPMVFALWAGKPGLPAAALAELVRGSYEFGKAHLTEILSKEFLQRGISRELAEAYLRRYIRYDIGTQEERGLEAFFEMARLTEGAKL